jgi:CRISPR system Cascade subunit CasA
MNEHATHNLLDDRWLPVRLADGSQQILTLAEIGRAEVVDIVIPRADFRGAIYQLLIGLLQTAFAPEGRKQWQNYWNEPPAPETLAAAFAPYSAAFVLDAPVGKPAFMQDLLLPLDSIEPVEALLFGGPGESTREKNTDHFIKRNTVSAVSTYWVAVLLYSFQINTAGGGSGHRVTLRGGGPLTTLVLPPESSAPTPLWQKLWLNILPRDRFSLIHGNHELTALADIFPWMAPTRTSENDEKTLPSDVNPLQMYWPMPARIRVAWDSSGETICDISGLTTRHFTRQVARKNKGVNYSGPWVHPLTPYQYKKPDEPISLKGREAGEGYKNWLALVLGSKNEHTEPATVVTQVMDRLRTVGMANEEARIWGFGYDLESAKAKCWYESEMPVLPIAAEQSDELAYRVEMMVIAADTALDLLKKSLKAALFRDPKNDANAKQFLKKTPDIDANFWSTTEPDFYARLHRLANALDNEDAQDEILAGWRTTLKREALALFDQYALSSCNEDGDLARVVRARDGKGGLNHHLNGNKALKALAA